MTEFKTDLNHKYKDRDPIETVKIINDFFTSLGYYIKIDPQMETSVDTFWCHLDLFDSNNRIIIGTNGKGTTLEYCLASGHAELYERYCANFHKRFYQLIDEYKQNYNLNHFYLEKDEKLLNFNEIKNTNLVLQEFFKIFNDENDLFLKFQSNFYGNIENKIPAVAFYNLDNLNDKLYLNPHIINKIIGSDGLAAGNTLEEAIVQGLSEIYEHYVTDQLYYNNSKNIVYYQLNINKLFFTLPIYLQNIITNIQNEGYQLYIYDLSYNYNLPVIMAVVINQNHQWYVNLGASPVFHIALERTLTEIYQGRMNFNGEEKTLMMPYRSFTIEDSIYNNYSSITSRNNYPEEIILNKQIISDYNKEIFLSSLNYSNKELLEHCKKINNKNKLDIYIKDLSQIDNLKAVRVFCSNKLVFPWRYSVCNLMDKSIRVKLTEYLLKLQQIPLYEKEYIDLLDKINNLIKEHKGSQNSIREFFSLLIDSVDIIFPTESLEEFFNFYEFYLKLDTDKITKITKEKFFYYKNLYNYKNSNKYSDQEIKRIFKFVLQYPINNIEEDLKQIFNKYYVIQNIFQDIKERI